MITNRLKIIILWLCLTIGLIMHTAQEAINYLFFTEMPTNLEKEGIPSMVHLINIVAVLLPMVFAVLTLYFHDKLFKLVSLVFAGLMILLNGFHLAEESANIDNYSLIASLLFILIAAILLFLSILKWRKED